MKFSGKQVESLASESGTHRVSRIPDNEKRGRRHTSAVTVSVLPVPPDIRVVLNEKDLRIETFRGTGPGGQHRNKTDTAVRVTHVPSGITASVLAGRSQYDNKQHAIEVVAARLLDKVSGKVSSKRDRLRAKHHGSGHISERFRSYLWREGSVVDHRTGVSAPLKAVLDGDFSAFLSG